MLELNKNIIEVKHITNSESETIFLAAAFSKQFLKKGDTVALFGELGSGKTRFVKGICSGLGYFANITSPSFKIFNEYTTKSLKIFHFDFYRIQDDNEINDIGFEDYIYNDGICIIEWAERIIKRLPPNRYDIFFKLGISENIREIEIKKLHE